MGTETIAGTETRAVEEMGTGTMIGTGMGTRRVEERRRSARNCTRVVNTMWETGDFGRKRKTRKKERVGPVAGNSDHLESKKKVEGGAQGTQGLSKNYTSRESVSPLSRLIRDFRNKYH